MHDYLDESRIRKHKSKYKPRPKSDHKHDYKPIHIIWYFSRDKEIYKTDCLGRKCSICGLTKLDKSYILTDVPQELFDLPTIIRKGDKYETIN